MIKFNGDENLEMDYHLQDYVGIIMDFFETVEKRASYRDAFAAQKIPEEDIRKIVTAGLHDPSGYNYQTTSFVVVRDPELRTKLAELLPTPATKTAPVILVAVSEQKINGAKGAANFAFDTQDYAAAVENFYAYNRCHGLCRRLDGRHVPYE